MQSLVHRYNNTYIASRDSLNSIALDPRRAEVEMCLPILGISSISHEDELALSIIYLEGNYILPTSNLHGLAADRRFVPFNNTWLILIEVSIIIGDIL